MADYSAPKRFRKLFNYEDTLHACMSLGHKTVLDALASENQPHDLCDECEHRLISDLVLNACTHGLLQAGRDKKTKCKDIEGVYFEDCGETDDESGVYQDFSLGDEPASETGRTIYRITVSRAPRFSYYRD